MSDSDKNLLILGRISSVFGIKGWIKCVSHSRPRENIFSYPTWLVRKGKAKDQEGWTEIEVEAGKPQGKTLVAKLAGIETREDAEAWVGADIAISRDMLPDADTDDFYWVDLIGLKVVTSEGDLIGTVIRLMETGSNDVLVVKDDKSRKEHLIPWVMEQFITAVDLSEGQITVDWDTDF